MVGREQRGPQAPSPLSPSLSLFPLEKQQNGPRTQRDHPLSIVVRSRLLLITFSRCRTRNETGSR